MFAITDWIAEICDRFTQASCLRRSLRHLDAAHDLAVSAGEIELADALRRLRTLWEVGEGHAALAALDEATRRYRQESAGGRRRRVS